MKFENHNFIGIFDSGIGGISVLNSCISLMPNENYVYFADSDNFPYGKKSKEELTNIGIKILSKFNDLNAKELIIACNTMSTNLKETSNEKYGNLHIVCTYPDITKIFTKGTIIKDTSINYSKSQGLSITRTRLKLLIIATTATCKSKYLNELIETCKNTIDIYLEPADFIVNAVERNKLDTIDFKNKLDDFFKEYSDIDYLFLGCTHFPHAIHNIREAINSKVQILSGGAAAAKSAYNYLNDNNKLTNNNSPYIYIIDKNLDDSKKQIYKSLIKSNNNIIFDNDFNI